MKITKPIPNHLKKLFTNAGIPTKPETKFPQSKLATMFMHENGKSAFQVNQGQRWAGCEFQLEPTDLFEDDGEPIYSWTTLNGTMPENERDDFNIFIRGFVKELKQIVTSSARSNS